MAGQVATKSRSMFAANLLHQKLIDEFLARDTNSTCQW